MDGPEGIQDRLRDQASRCDFPFLIGALEHVNAADVAYRSSQHQRLLVELMLMQICSLGADKKKR
jgi:DNA polymerase-3 subunit gamma/tau